MDQAVDAFLEFHERAERREVAHFARHHVADLEIGRHALPRIGFQLLDAE